MDGQIVAEGASVGIRSERAGFGTHDDIDLVTWTWKKGQYRTHLKALDA